MSQNSKIQTLIEEATSTSLNRPDMNLNQQVCQEINSKAEFAKGAVQTFKKRFSTKEAKVIALTLELLDMAMVKCGNPLHVQVCTKEFMNILVSFLNMKSLPQPIIKRILSLIQTWGLRFEKDRDILPLFSDVYSALKNKGIPFPEVQKPVPPPQMKKAGSSSVKVAKKYEKLL
mmetsp:Transcript_35384/g.34421  ORF Transcript_35384/g.34421 Transcript_35384/m.34421 type:complete len:174 (+) Transcript_35384:3-524(+)